MKNDGERPPEGRRPANDNGAEPDAETWRRLDQVVLGIARLIGRQMAREDFERLRAANDNRKAGDDDKD